MVNFQTTFRRTFGFLSTTIRLFKTIEVRFTCEEIVIK